jgi:LPXTG-motif cell wall-anchored protein
MLLGVIPFRHTVTFVKPHGNGWQLTVEGLFRMSTNTSGAGSLSRRATLKGAGLAVGTLWVAPLVQVISMDSAAAASAPPARVQTTTGGTTTVASGPVSEGQLASTGSSETVGIAAAGVAAVAVGAAAVVASRRLSSTEPVDTDE